MPIKQSQNDIVASTNAATAAAQAASTAANAAIALAKTSAETAAALASAKVTSDTTSALIAKDISYIQQDMVKINKKLDDMSAKDETYVLKEDFFFWRNILVSGLLLTIVIGIISKFLK